MKLVTSNRESDGKFALRLESEKSFAQDNKRIQERLQREQELRNDPANAAFLEQGIDPSEIFA